MNTDFTSKFTIARNIAAKYELNTDKLTAALDELPEFRVTAPLVGGFSTGKSSLINAVIGENLLSTAITPETAVPTEITGGSDTAVIVSGGKETVVPLSQFDSTQLAADNNSLVKIRTSNPFFAQIPSVKLVDMPGFDSGYEVHNRAIDEYMPRSLAYILTVAADEGTLRESIITFLNELKLYDVPVYVVITKSAKVEPETLEALKSHIAETVRRFLKVDDVKIAVTNAKGKNTDTEGFKAFLLELQSNSEEIYNSYFSSKLLSACQSIEKYLSDRLGKGDLTLEELKLQKQQAQESFDSLTTKYEDEKSRFAKQVENCIASIRSKIESDLNASKNTIESLILQGQESAIREKVNSVVRNACATIIQTELEPKVKRYIANVEGAIQVDIYDTTAELSKQEIELDKETKNVVADTIAPAIGAVIGAFVIPIPIVGELVGAAVGALVNFLVGKGINDKQKAQREEIARQKASEIIENTLVEAGNKISAQIYQYIDKVNDNLAAEIEAEKQIKSKALADCEEKLRLGAAERERMTAELTADLKTIRGITDGI